MSFSFTAPQFTERQQEEERRGLSEEERERIEADAYGAALEIEETEELLEKSLAEFKQHLEALSDYDKTDYQEALKRCPELVEKESDPIRFLRCEEFEAKKAAKRFAAYWTHRRRLFGEDKAFLPMTLDGALSEEDIELMRTIPEYYIFLPGLDDHGRVVFMTDKTRVDFRKHDRYAITRVLWYHLHVALQNEALQKKGMVVIGVMRITHLGQMDRRQQVLTFRAVNQALPIKCAAVHFCHVPAFFSVVWPVLAFVMGSKIRQRCFIRKGSEEQVLHELKKFGIPARMLPKAHMGGEWELDIEEWMAARRLVERGETKQENEQFASEATENKEQQQQSL